MGLRAGHSQDENLQISAQDIWARSTAEGAVEERGEEVFGLTQRLALHGTQTLYSLREFQESLLMADVRHWDAHLADLVEVQPWFCLAILHARNLSLPAGA
jgi:hypothetical protein